MDSGDFNKALSLARKIQSLKEHLDSKTVPRFILNVSGLLIDIGGALNREDIVQEGIEILRKDFEIISVDTAHSVIAHYNLANGYFSLIHFKKRNNPCIVYFNTTELNRACDLYRTALELGPKDPLIGSQIWVNLGNCFDCLGRTVDALDCYEKAISLKRDHSMAIGNKGVGLFSYAVVAGEHQGTFLIEAYSLISQALKLGVDSEALHHFEGYLRAIRSRFKGKEHLLEEAPKYPGYKITTESEFENFLVKFCLNNKLYLNICNNCQRCDAAIGDTAVIRKMIVPLANETNEDWPKSDHYLRLSAYINQIKQDYVTARFLLVLSKYKGLNLGFVDRNVKIIDTLDYSMHNIRIELVKSAFKGFYDILDKIAYFINDYLGLGIREERVDFRTVWYSGKHKDIHEQIRDTNNVSLNALFDIHRDFEEGPYKRLRLMRNGLTHRFIDVRVFREEEDDLSMTEDILVERTLELARVARNSILYLLQFVGIEETKKEKEAKGILAPMFAQELPDNLKDYYP
jgi:tetratricopeptide (TPR) repeat protein